eukprot:g33223.t1
MEERMLCAVTEALPFMKALDLRLAVRFRLGRWVAQPLSTPTFVATNQVSLRCALYAWRRLHRAREALRATERAGPPSLREERSWLALRNTLLDVEAEAGMPRDVREVRLARAEQSRASHRQKLLERWNRQQMAHEDRLGKAERKRERRDGPTALTFSDALCTPELMFFPRRIGDLLDEEPATTPGTMPATPSETPMQTLEEMISLPEEDAEKEARAAAELLQQAAQASEALAQQLPEALKRARKAEMEAQKLRESLAEAEAKIAGLQAQQLRLADGLLGEIRQRDAELALLRMASAAANPEEDSRERELEQEVVTLNEGQVNAFLRTDSEFVGDSRSEGTESLPDGKATASETRRSYNKGHDEDACSPCVFFPTPRGCVRGEECAYCHLSHDLVRVRGDHSLQFRNKTRKKINERIQKLFESPNLDPQLRLGRSNVSCDGCGRKVKVPPNLVTKSITRTQALCVPSLVAT